MEKFRKLKVWEKAHSLVLDFYKITEDFPKEEKYALVQQIRRAMVSVVANIAEGTKRRTPKDKRHFYVISDTSLEEVKYYIILCYHLNYITTAQAKDLTDKSRLIGGMLNGLIKKQI